MGATQQKYTVSPRGVATHAPTGNGETTVVGMRTGKITPKTMDMGVISACSPGIGVISGVAERSWNI